MAQAPNLSVPGSPPQACIAVTREVSSAMSHCELTHLERAVIDIDLARRQHDAYEQALRNAGCRIERLPEEPGLPDSVFVEDTALVLDEVAVITRPGARSRRAETASIAAALGRYRKLVRIERPGTLDGGDVLRIGRALHVGTSSRSNASGLEQLRALLAPFGYRVRAVPVTGCLHLKTAVTQVADDRLLINSRYVEPGHFPMMQCTEVDESEPLGANALRVGAGVILPASQPRTGDILRRQGIAVHTVDMSEMEKAEGGVTCCSLLIDRGVT
jgi:dimethylargininase